MNLDEAHGFYERDVSWHIDALCAQTDPELFYPEKGGTTKPAKDICGTCTVRAECLEYGQARASSSTLTEKITAALRTRRSEHKRTQALGVKLTELAERDTAEAKAKQAEEFTAKKAQVDRLAKQLADARAALRELKPTGVTQAALDFACAECGDLFSTSQGRGMHVFRKHKTKEQTT